MRTVNQTVTVGEVSVDVGEVDVDIDPKEVLDELSIPDILGYIETRDQNAQLVGNSEIKDIARSVWHRDLDLAALIKEIGVTEVQRVMGTLQA